MWIRAMTWIKADSPNILIPRTLTPATSQHRVSFRIKKSRMMMQYLFLIAVSCYSIDCEGVPFVFKSSMNGARFTWLKYTTEPPPIFSWVCSSRLYVVRNISTRTKNKLFHIYRRNSRWERCCCQRLSKVKVRVGAKGLIVGVVKWSEGKGFCSL